MDRSIRCEGLDTNDPALGSAAIDYVNLTRICEFTRALHRFHQIGGDEVIDREFNAVCRQNMATVEPEAPQLLPH